MPWHINEFADHWREESSAQKRALAFLNRNDIPPPHVRISTKMMHGNIIPFGKITWLVVTVWWWTETKEKP